jgi:hypothetical protein
MTLLTSAPETGDTAGTGPHNVIDGIGRAVHDAAQTPTDIDVLTERADLSALGGTVSTPFYTAAIVSQIRTRKSNTDFVRWALNTSGEKIGKILDATWNMDVQIDIWVAEGDDRYNVTHLGHQLQRALYRYDNEVRGDLLPGPDGTVMETVDEVTVTDGQRNDDLTTSPTARRWRQSVEASFRDRVNTVDLYGPVDVIREVNSPRPGGIVSQDGNMLEYDPELVADA